MVAACASCGGGIGWTLPPLWITRLDRFNRYVKIKVDREVITAGMLFPTDVGFHRKCRNIVYLLPARIVLSLLSVFNLVRKDPLTRVDVRFQNLAPAAQNE